MTPVDLRNALEEMHPDELAEFLERLLAVAVSMLRLHGTRARHYALMAEDLVNEALAKALSGERLCPDGLPLYVFFVGVIRSLVSHAAESASHAKRVSIESDDEESHGLHELPADDDVDATATANVMKDEFKETLDAELREYVDLRVEESGSTAEELAEKIVKPVQHIRNLDRKLARRRAQWNSR